eukprot:8749910-Alexandrium_andersonii.AAC.1
MNACALAHTCPCAFARQTGPSTLPLVHLYSAASHHCRAAPSLVHLYGAASHHCRAAPTNSAYSQARHAKELLTPQCAA